MQHAAAGCLDPGASPPSHCQAQTVSSVLGKAAATGSRADSELEKRPHRGGTGAPVQGWLPAWEGDVPANPSGRWAN